PPITPASRLSPRRTIVRHHYERIGDGQHILETSPGRGILHVGILNPGKRRRAIARWRDLCHNNGEPCVTCNIAHLQGYLIVVPLPPGYILQARAQTELRAIFACGDSYSHRVGETRATASLPLRTWEEHALAARDLCIDRMEPGEPKPKKPRKQA